MAELCINVFVEHHCLKKEEAVHIIFNMSPDFALISIVHPKKSYIIHPQIISNPFAVIFSVQQKD